MPVTPDTLTLLSRIDLNWPISRQYSCQRQSSGYLVFWKDKRLSLSNKLRVYLALVQSVLLYASETWTLTVADSKSLDAFHMKCQRRILGISWHQFVRNEEVAALTGLSSLSDIICRRRSAIFGLIARLGRKCLPTRHSATASAYLLDVYRTFPGSVVLVVHVADNSQPPADLWRQAINRGHSGRATQRSSDYATTWPDRTCVQKLDLRPRFFIISEVAALAWDNGTAVHCAWLMTY